ncbi:hypothetical protein AMS57_06165 [Pseudoalteromonas undina]|nr:hypothetical protein AMS57_06165 [Pseudoalteromonas undina]
MIGSFLLFAAWFYFERKKALLIKPKSIQDFAHTSSELVEINRQENQLENIYNRLDQISYEGRSLSKRQDGKFNERSKKGKEFNREVDNLAPEADNFEQSLADLEALPEKRLNNWAFYASMNIASRISVLSYILSFALFVWLEPVWVMQLSQFLQSITFLDFYASYPIAYGASVGSLFISLAVLGGALFYYREAKKESLKNTQIPQAEPEQISEQSVEITSIDIGELLSSLPHSELKILADEFNIMADRRSKKAILEAIKEADVSELLKFIRKTQNAA